MTKQMFVDFGKKKFQSIKGIMISININRDFIPIV